MLQNSIYNPLDPVAQTSPTMKHPIPVYQTPSPIPLIPEFQGLNNNTRNCTPTNDPQRDYGNRGTNNPGNGNNRDGFHSGSGNCFGNCLATLEKIYKEDCKYSGRNDNFDHKLGIFYDLCLKANVTTSEAYKAAYSTML